MCIENIFRRNVNKKNIKINNEVIKDNVNVGTDLIVDDSDANRVVIKRYLTLFDRKVDEASNGYDAIKKIKINTNPDTINTNQLNNYDIIWMDIQMPRMNGIKCTEYLRNELKYTGIIIGLTGHVDGNTIKECEKAGMNAILPKPIEKNVLMTYIEKYKHVKNQ